VTLNDLERLFCVKFCFRADLAGSDYATFRKELRKPNKDRHIQSVVQIFCRKSTFWKVCADIRSSSLERRQRTMGLRVNARLQHLFLAFKNNCIKVNTDRPILLQCNVAQELVSGNIKFVWVSAGVLFKETSNDNGVMRRAHVLQSHAEVYSL